MQVWATYGLVKIADCWPFPLNRSSMTLRQRIRNPYFGFSVSVFVNIKGKGKAIPLQAWTGPEGSRRLRFPDFKTIGT